MRYQIWDKKSDIYTFGKDETGKSHFTAAEWAARYPWINIPGAKMIITANPINGGAAMEFSTTVERYKESGAAITDGMTDDEILAAIEDFEINPPGSDEPSVDERTAAALEFLAMNSLPDASENEINSVATLSATMKINGVNKTDEKDWSTAKANYERRLWSKAQLKIAVKKGTITAAQYQEITGDTYK